MSKSKARRDREYKRSLTAAQEVLYQRAFKKADRAGGFVPRNSNA